MSLFDRIRRGDYVADLVAGPESLTGRSVSLAEVAVRVSEGENVLPAIRDFLDQVDRRDDAELAELIRSRPEPAGSRKADALLAGSQSISLPSGACRVRPGCESRSGS